MPTPPPPISQPPPPPPPPDLYSVDAAIAAIKLRDAAFDLDLFLAEAQQAFWLVGRAHAECKPELCRAVLSADLAAREQTEITEACQHGKIIAPAPDDASSGRLMSLSSDAFDDTAVVHFTSTWRPVATPGPTGQRQPHDGHDDPDVDRRDQHWCFQRLSGSLTMHAAQGERCHNCGASLDASTGSCRFCGAAMSAGSGWRVIRIDDIDPQQLGGVEGAATAVQSMIAELSSHRQFNQPVPATLGRRLHVGRWIGRLVTLFVALAIVVFIGAGLNNSLHSAVVKVFPSLRHPEFGGPLDLQGELQASQLHAVLDGAPFVFRGTCDKQVSKTAWVFRTKLVDGSSFTMTISLPPGSGGQGVHSPPELQLTAEADNGARSQLWALVGESPNASLTVDSSGDYLQFSDMISSSGGTLSGHLAWSCALK